MTTVVLAGESLLRTWSVHLLVPCLLLQVRNAASLCYTALLVRVLGFRNAAGKVSRGWLLRPC